MTYIWYNLTTNFLERMLIMEQIRSNNELINAKLKEEFKWIKDIHKVKNFFPACKETYELSFEHKQPKMENCWNETNQRKKLEDYILQFYDTVSRKHQVILCWRETGVIVIVF